MRFRSIALLAIAALLALRTLLLRRRAAAISAGFAPFNQFFDRLSQRYGIMVERSFSPSSHNVLAAPTPLARSSGCDSSSATCLCGTVTLQPL